MPVLRGDCSTMPCESCAVQFSVFRRKRACCECERYYCSGCLRRGGGAMCAPCRVLSTRPLSRQMIAHLKVRDLQFFLQRQNVSTRGCVEKEELVNLCVSHVNSTSYRRHGPRAGSGPFSTLKGFTNNINVLINSAFDLRTAQPAPPPQPYSGCYNATHMHPHPPASPATPTTPAAPAAPAAPRERFTTTPGGERDLFVPVPAAEGAPEPAAEGGALRETADCYEIEDLDDAGWEFVTRPAEPLPNDSEVLIAENEANIEIDVIAPTEPWAERGGAASPPGPVPSPPGPVPTPPGPVPAPRAPGRLRAGAGRGTPQRAASELELHRPEPAADTADSSSLQDEPLMDHSESFPKHITLEHLKSAEELEALNVKQLKELLARNRVEYRGCLERAELLQRAQTLWRDHVHYKDEIDNLPLEECCKICMAAPLECVLLECGHMAACTACSKQLAECPICRQYVVRAVRVFRS